MLRDNRTDFSGKYEIAFFFCTAVLTLIDFLTRAIKSLGGLGGSSPSIKGKLLKMKCAR